MWDGKAFVPRLMLPLSLSWDHRVIDGASAARFNAYLGQVLGGLPPGACCKGRTDMAVIEVKVPDIGDFKDVGVIEVLVKPGDSVEVEQSLHHGRERQGVDGDPVVRRRRGQGTEGEGGRHGQHGLGDPDAGGGRGAPPPRRRPHPRRGGARAAAAPAPRARAGSAPAPRRARGPAPVASTYGGGADIECDLLVLGGGPGGYSAAFRAADLGMKVVLVERYATLGGVCLNVGCIPSKALLHVAMVMDEVKHFADLGVTFGAPQLDIAKLRTHKGKVVGKLTGGLGAMAKMRKVTVVRGYGNFIDPYHVKVDETAGEGQQTTGSSKTVKFKQAVIAAGSQAVRLPFFPDDPRIVDSTGALELRDSPKRMLIVGGGIIGLEMGTVYSTLGARLDVVEMLDGLMQGADRDLVKVWQKMNAKRFDNILLKTKTVGAEATADGIKVRFEGEGGASEAALRPGAAGGGPHAQRQEDRRRQGGRGRRRPRLHPGRRADAHQRAAHLRDRRHRRPADARAQGGARGPRGGRGAPRATRMRAFDARVIPSVAYTDPEVAWVGLTEDQAKAQGIAVKKGLFPWTASGRAIANGRDEG